MVGLGVGGRLGGGEGGEGVGGAWGCQLDILLRRLL